MQTNWRLFLSTFLLLILPIVILFPSTYFFEGNICALIIWFIYLFSLQAISAFYSKRNDKVKEFYDFNFQIDFYKKYSIMKRDYRVKLIILVFALIVGIVEYLYLTYIANSALGSVVFSFIIYFVLLASFIKFIKCTKFNFEN